ncbi:universal stress protein [Parafrigoribacterium mesophilum]|uniref:universal stress protein n=1 Tax=Parafrigoribacterium mesophilum TaxID=433646 RepID=UPI0031FD2F65
MSEQADVPGRAKSVVVGVVPHQSDAVLLRAADFAAALGAELVCVGVDRSRYTVGENPDGSPVTLPFDPDLPELGDAEFDAALQGHIEELLRDKAVRWSVHAVAGEPVRALAQLADTLDAEMIVVGTRDGARSSIQEFFGGSLAVHLAHRQKRPVMVIPVSPTPRGEKLPWEDA